MHDTENQSPPLNLNLKNLPVPNPLKITSILLATVAIGGACKSKPTKTVAADDASTATVQIDARPVKMTIHKELPQHFTFLNAAKDSLLFSDLTGTRDALQWITDATDEGLSPESWKPYNEELRAIAAEASGSQDVMTLTDAVAKFARTCGACHTATGTKPIIKVKEPKNRGLDFKDHMAGHKWALDKMWVGLAAPSDADWVAGAKLLSDAPTHLRNLSDYEDDADKAMDLAIEVHALAAKAVKEKDTAARVQIFGKFLSACAQCHEMPGSAPTSEDDAP